MRHEVKDEYPISAFILAQCAVTVEMLPVCSQASFCLCQDTSVFSLRFSRKVIMQNVSFQI